MSDAAKADWAARTEALSVEDALFVISLLAEKLKKQFSATVSAAKEEKPAVSKEREAIDAIFARADALHLSTNGEKWTREELYDR